jgi:hypothetical protein
MRRIRALAAVLLLTGCGESDSAGTDDTSISEETVLDDAAVTEEEPTAEESEDTSVPDFLTEAGIDDAMLNRVTAVAEANRLVDVCRQVAAGEWTYEGHEADDISTGGTPAQAGAMRRFMQDTFCPVVQPEK